MVGILRLLLTRAIYEESIVEQAQKLIDRYSRSYREESHLTQSSGGLLLQESASSNALDAKQIMRIADIKCYNGSIFLIRILKVQI